MKKTKLNFLKYPGSKIRFIETINNEINSQRYLVDTYVEPFLGSGSVFLNIPFKFKKYILSDIDENVIKLWNIFKYKYDDLILFYKINFLKYGNPGNKKDVYYKIRNELNKKYFNTYLKEESFFLYFISKCAINSMFRVGPNGFNQGWGNRGNKVSLSRNDFEIIQNKFLSNNLNILHQNFFDLYESQYDILNNKKSLLFLDPPYTELSYGYRLEKTFNKDVFLNIINNLNSKIIYTDVYSKDIIKKLNWRIVSLRKMNNIAPNSKKHSTKEEVMYINF